ncbi:NAD(P)-dependent oxidoreductase [Fibrisoma montanum]|uniref:NAD(P)-dependent oxidoreductase n=1 Tax=Fibrisoma montanum TaxID=2305895 RepID=A0A418M6V7_9BACT|nr:NAD(P)-dependent oxidoreductase [Fibrisoma montanum]RIV21594.1 NAD(P)-dependent oxidoreductase [Fibrisoma montanum]
MHIGFIGLGQMGIAMAHNLLKNDHSLAVHNRTRDKAEPLIRAGATWASSPAEAAYEADVVFTMVSDDAALRDVTMGELGLLNGLSEEAVHVSCSTISPDTARQLAQEHQHRNSRYVASPVFGKPEVAQAGKLWVCVSGETTAKEDVRPFLNLIGQGIFDFGDDPGAANVVKLSGNFLLGCAIEAMAEAFTLGEKNNISRTSLYEFFSTTLFASPVYKNYGKLIADEVYQPVGATPALIRKDMRLLLDEAQKALVPMPFADIVFQQLTATVAKGKTDIDWAGFAGEVSEKAGVVRPKS